MTRPDLQFDVNTELAARRTGMAFQRTRLAEDRTLMAVIRTALSLIGFGFTIFQFFRTLREREVISSATAPRNFGVALVALGVLMLVLGIIYHARFMLGLRRLRKSMSEDGLIHGETNLPRVLDPDHGPPSPGDRPFGHSEHGVQHRAFLDRGSGWRQRETLPSRRVKWRTKRNRTY